MPVNNLNRKKTPKLPQNRLTAILKGFAIYVLIGLAALIFLVNISGSGTTGKEIALSQAINDIQDKKVDKIVVEGDKVEVNYREGQPDKVAIAHKEGGQSIYQILKNSDVDPKSVQIDIKDMSWQQAWVSILGTILPILLMAGIFFFIFRQAREGAQGIFSFGQSRAKIFSKDAPQVKFADVAGVSEAKRELSEVVEFLKTPDKFKALGARIPKGVLLVGPAGTGKCVTGDTYIWTNKGLMEIKDVPKYYFVDDKNNKAYGAGLTSFNIENVTPEKQYASHWFDLGHQKTYQIRTDQGFSLEGTPEHPVVVMSDDGRLRFKQLSKIQPGDYLAIQFGQRAFGNSGLMDADTAYLLGLLTGDGNLSHAGRIGLTSIDDEIIKFFKDYVTKYFPKNVVYENKQSYLVSSWQFKKYLYNLGISYLLSFDKTIPASILQAPEDIQIAFLQGLFDTDASVEKKRAAFEYSTVSQKMARQVQMLLLNIGIISSLNIKGRHENGYYRDVFRITLTGAFFREFANKVGFRLTRKQNLLYTHCQKTEKTNTNIDIIPGVSNLVVESWKTLSKQKLSNERLSKTIDKVKRRGRVSRATLTEYLKNVSNYQIEIPHVDYLNNLLEAQLFFSKVVEKNQSTGQVYDFTIPKTHSFIGNGFINHNTMLSRAVAGEAGVPFFSIAGSEFMEMLVGVGAARVRDMFLTAKKNAPSIIFIDEIESIGRMRGMGISGGHDEREQTLNQILVEMDGFAPNDHCIVIGATNRPDLLDPALIRPGRFDRRVVLGLPDLEERKAIITIHMKGKPFTKEVSIERIARRTVGFTGADLANMLNEAAILAARENKTAIDAKDLEEAATKEKLGPQRKRMLSDYDRKLSAYHEAGHAIVGHFSENVDPVHRISIVSRGMSGGHTMFPPTEDRSNETKSRLIEQIATALGGQAAEELVFNDISTGAASDIESATAIAKAMVTQYGMSSLGPINVQAQPMFGMWSKGDEGMDISQQLHDKVDVEIKRLIDQGMIRALSIIRKNRKYLDKVAAALLDVETLDSDEFEKIVGRKKTADRSKSRIDITDTDTPAV